MRGDMERENWCLLGMVGITHKLTQAHRPTGTPAHGVRFVSFSSFSPPPRTTSLISSDTIPVYRLPCLSTPAARRSAPPPRGPCARPWPLDSHPCDF